MPTYTITTVQSTPGTGTADANVEPVITWLDPYPDTSPGGYYAFDASGVGIKLQFSATDADGLADRTSTYNNNQVVIGRLGGLATAGVGIARICLLLHCAGGAADGSGASYYILEISQDSQVLPLTTKIFRVVNSATPVLIASSNTITWANGHQAMFVDYEGMLEVYQDSGSGFPSTPVLTANEIATRLLGGGPGILIRRPDTYTWRDLVFGNASISADTTPPTLSSPIGAGGLAVCSGTVSTNEAGGTLYAVATASATAPTALQVRNGQDHTGAAALRVVSQAVSSSGTQTVASGAITGGAGTRYLHYMHEDAAGNRSAVVSSAGFAVTATATQLVLTVPDAAGLTGFTGVVLSAATPGAGVTVIKTLTGVSFNGSGQATLDISGLGVAVGAYRWVSVTNSDGTPGQSPAPVQAQGPVIAS